MDRQGANRPRSRPAWHSLITKMRCHDDLSPSPALLQYPAGALNADHGIVRAQFHGLGRMTMVAGSLEAKLARASFAIFDYVRLKILQNQKSSSGSVLMNGPPDYVPHP